MSTAVKSRLFVPLASEPHRWFESGRKCWELRGAKAQYTANHVYVGRYVELRRGYSDRATALFGIITTVAQSDSIQGIFDSVPYSEVIPDTKSIEEAAEVATDIVGECKGYICFKIRKLQDSDYIRRIDFKQIFLAPVCQLRKRTTIRRANSVSVGPYIFDFEGKIIKGFVTKILSKKQIQLTDEDALSDGFDSVSKLKQAILEYYPDTTSETELDICHFNLVSVC